LCRELAKVLGARYVGESRFVEKLMRPCVVCLAALLLGTACTKKPPADTAQDSLTRRQKDSAIGASAIPGAQGVRGAMNAADSAAARTAAIDSTGAAIQ
jgi:hypothetical protein